MSEEPKQLKTGYQVIAEQTLTEQEAAHILGITKYTLAHIRLKAGISYRQITRTKVLYHVDDILEYLDRKKVGSDAGKWVTEKA